VSDSKHPMQPVMIDKHGVARFKANAIVQFLLDKGPFDLNKLATMPFTNEDREQFAQLIGYSVGGYGELSYVSLGDDATVHELKTWPGAFAAVASGAKRHEYRRDDRGFMERDELHLREWDPDRSEYTGNELRARVTYISRGPEYGIPWGFCVMSIEVVDRFEAKGAK
jgi:hypothetical protein